MKLQKHSVDLRHPLGAEQIADRRRSSSKRAFLARPAAIPVEQRLDHALGEGGEVVDFTALRVIAGINSFCCFFYHADIALRTTFDMNDGFELFQVHGRLDHFEGGGLPDSQNTVGSSELAPKKNNDSKMLHFV